MPQKCDISVWPIATPSDIIVNTVYIILVVLLKYILYIRFQKYCLICTSDWAHKKLQYFNGEFHSLVIGDFCARIIPPWDLHVPFTCIIGRPAILLLAIVLHNVCFILHLYLHKWCQERNTGKTAKIESQNTFGSAVAYWFVLSPRNQRVDGSIPAQCVYP